MRHILSQIRMLTGGTLNEGLFDDTPMARTIADADQHINSQWGHAVLNPIGHADRSSHEWPIEGDDWVVLSSLEASKPNKGYGTKMMEVICDAADRHGAKIYLDASAYGRGLSQNALVEFYMNFGFEYFSEMKGFANFPMARIPNAGVNESSELISDMILDESEVVNELFGGNRTIEWISRDSMAWVGDFKVGSIPFRASITKINKNDMDRWVMVFKASGTPDAFGNTGMSRQHAPMVMAHVVQALQTFIENQRPDEVVFAGDIENGKGKLYQAIANRLSPTLHGLGYRIEAEEEYGERMFRIIALEAGE